MMRLLARLHQRPNQAQATNGSIRRSAVLGVITSSVVFLHLLALGVGSAVLFVGSGEGYTTGETIMLAVLAIVGVLAFTRTVRLLRSRRTTTSA